MIAAYPIETETMSVPSIKVTNMKRKIWTGAELKKMTPAERGAISRSTEVLDPADFPELLERAREAARRHIDTPVSQRPPSWPADKFTELDADKLETLMRLVRNKEYEQIDLLLG